MATFSASYLFLRASKLSTIHHPTTRTYTKQERSCDTKFRHCMCRERSEDPTISARQNGKAPAIGNPTWAPIEKIEGQQHHYGTTLDSFGGILAEGGRVFQQCLSVKSYEVDGDLKLTVETLMKYMQETIFNHWKSLGLAAGGLGGTPEMCKRNLIWVFRRTHISIHSYPSWGEVIEVKTWSHVSRGGLRVQWLLRNIKTGETVAKAVSVFVIMDKHKRKLSTLVDEVLREIKPYSLNCDPNVHKDDKRLRRFDISRADHVRTGLTPIWNDLDTNSHVSNLKYINWIIEGVPHLILRKYVLQDVWLELRTECGIDSKLQSLSTKVEDGIDQGSRKEGMIELDHLLLQHDGTEVARARTKWRPKRSLLTSPCVNGREMD